MKLLSYLTSSAAVLTHPMMSAAAFDCSSQQSAFIVSPQPRVGSEHLTGATQRSMRHPLQATARASVNALSLKRFLTDFEYQQDGFAYHPGMVTGDRISEIIQALNRVTDHDINSIRNRPHLVRWIREVNQLAYDPTLLRLVIQTLPTDKLNKRSMDNLLQCVELKRSTLMDKPKDRVKWRVLWHQDKPTKSKGRVEHQEDDEIIAVVLRISLDPATLENGCLKVIPGSHHYGVLNKASLLEMVERSSGQIVDCEMDAGDVLLFDPLLVHASGVNESGESRKVIHLEYQMKVDTLSALGLW